MGHKHWNRGRKREAGARFLSGGLKRNTRADAPLTLSRRAAVVGEENATDQRAGTALGIALFVGALGHYNARAMGESARNANADALRRWFAGTLFSRAHRRWTRIEAIPPRAVMQPCGGRGLVEDPAPEFAARVVRDWSNATEALSSAGLCAYRVVDDVAITDTLPGDLLRPGSASAENLRRGLDALADFFQVG